MINLLLDFTPNLINTDINQNDSRLTIGKQQIKELKQKYIQNPPKGMTAKLIKNMSDSDLLPTCYFNVWLLHKEKFSIALHKPHKSRKSYG